MRTMRIICVLLLTTLFSGCAHQPPSPQPHQNPFKDPDYITYLNYIHQMDAMAENGGISKADAETRKYDAWMQYKALTRQKNYQEAVLTQQAAMSRQQAEIARQASADRNMPMSCTTGFFGQTKCEPDPYAKLGDTMGTLIGKAAAKQDNSE